MKTIGLFLFICLFSYPPILAQSDSTWAKPPQVTLSGFTDVFYSYDFNKPQDKYRQNFFFNHNRHNQFNLNLALLKVNVNHSKYRANIALHAGTYPNDNYAAEPGLLKAINEANVGLSLNKKNTLWLDAGILPSYLGFESALSIDNFTLTRSLCAESSPYFVTGAKLSYQAKESLQISGLIMNGWQTIEGIPGQSLPAFGTQINYTINKKSAISYNTFIGSVYPDSTRRMRFFQDLYGNFTLNNKIKVVAGFDIGIEQKSKGNKDFNLWLSPTLIAQYSINAKWKSALRIEYYYDPNHVIIPQTASSNLGFTTLGLSGNIDYTPISFLACRLEARWLQSPNKIFINPNGMSKQDVFITVSIALKFEQVLFRK